MEFRFVCELTAKLHDKKSRKDHANVIYTNGARKKKKQKHTTKLPTHTVIIKIVF